MWLKTKQPLMWVVQFLKSAHPCELKTVWPKNKTPSTINAATAPSMALILTQGQYKQESQNSSDNKNSSAYALKTSCS